MIDHRNAICLSYNANSGRFEAGHIVGLERYENILTTVQWLMKAGADLEARARASRDAWIARQAKQAKMDPADWQFVEQRSLLSFFTSEWERTMFCRYKQFEAVENSRQQYIQIALAAANAQQAYLHAGGDLTELNRLTYQQLASKTGWSDRTIRRRVQENRLRVSWQGRIYPILNLMCSNDRMWLVPKVLPIVEADESIGAPKLQCLLAEQGVHVSQRLVGRAKQLALMILRRKKVLRL